MPAISIIVPVYNSASFLRAAIDSILNQDFDDYELLLVDDGSTDSSGILCDELAAEHDRIKVFHKDNGGMCQTRNYALDLAQGDYVTFCDNDDMFLAHHLSDNYRIALANDADCVRFGRQLVLQDELSSKARVSNAGPKETGVFHAEEIFSHYRSVRNNSLGVWNGLYRKSLLNEHHIRFDERLRHGFEDQLFNFAVFNAAKTIATNTGVYYAWMRRASHSSSFRITDDYKLGFESSIRTEHDLLIKHGVALQDPSFFGWVMVNQMLSPIETMLLGNNVSPDAAIPLLEWEHELFLPYKNEVLSCPLSMPYRIMFTLLTAKRYHMMLMGVRMAGLYLKATKR